MPPKNKNKDAKKQKDAEKRNKAKKVAKSAEDKTFGLKNKNKSKKVQQHIATVTNVAENKRQSDLEKRKAAEKKAADEAKKEAAKLLQSSISSQKIPFGVDPKSILCQFFKAGACTRGKNCKFSHDLNIGRKAVKKDLYTDDKDMKSEKELDTMDNWDEEKLRKVVLSKQGNLKTTTDIVCKHFIKAVEDGKYGWFWTCPDEEQKNIGCKYRHSLPPGFVLKTKEQRRLEKLAADQQPKITLEEFIETERDKLPKNKLTPITQESFSKWKTEHIQKKLNEKAKSEAAKSTKTGKQIILERFQNKFFQEEEIAKDRGTEIDMSQFKKALDDVEEGEDEEEIKDYGDGTGAFLKANS